MIEQKYLDLLLEKAKAAGFEKAEVYVTERDSFLVSVYEQEIDKYSVNSQSGLSFRGLYGGKMGYAYSEVVDEQAVPFLIDSAIQSAQAVENDDVQFIFGDKCAYAKVDGFSRELSEVTAKDKIAFCHELEREAKALDPRITKVPYDQISTSSAQVTIKNTEGLNLTHKNNYYVAVAEALAEHEGKMLTGFTFKAGRDFAALSAKDLAQKAVTETLDYIGATQVPSGKYRAILRHDMVTAMLGTFASVFSADNAQKGFSLLKGKEGQKIASEAFTLTDDPHAEGCIAAMPFDDEGVPTQKKDIIAAGTLTTLLHNLKTANKQGVRTTGNASKAGYKAPIGVSPIHLVVKPGADSYDQLLGRMGTGLVITQLQGLHSGANAISGDFSLAAKGFYVEHGKAKHPVEQITMAGNFFKLLEAVEAVADDSFFDLDACAITAPSVLISELSIAGS